jgi:hypothetical protein
MVLSWIYRSVCKLGISNIDLFVEIIVEKINFHDIAWKSSWKRLIFTTLYRVHHTYINLFHDDFRSISWRVFFYISHYSVTEINPFHDGSVAENTTEQGNWYFSSAAVSSWKGLTFIIHVYFPRYSVKIIVEKEKAFDIVWRDGLWYKLLMRVI